MHTWPLIVAASVLSQAPAVTVAGRPSAPVHAWFDAHAAPRVAPLLLDVVRFPTMAGHKDAHVRQKAWVAKTAKMLGLTARDANTVMEVELPGPPGSPVLGLLVHGDVVTVEGDWSFPPFEGRHENGMVKGRGVADDKGPVVLALLGMAALKEAGPARTHTVRLLVGSDEESGGEDMDTYLKTHAAPDYSLVLDSHFPVVVGEKAWNALSVTAVASATAESLRAPLHITNLVAGTSPSIVPDRAVLSVAGRPQELNKLALALQTRKPDAGTVMTLERGPSGMDVVVKGRAAHSGVNIRGGRNALVSLAHLMEGLMPPGGENDLLAFARMAGTDLVGTGLALAPPQGIWGGHSVNVAVIKPGDAPHTRTLVINIRRPPPDTGAQLRAHLEAQVRAFNARTHASLVADGYYKSEPLEFDPRSPLVVRLLDIYARATGTRLPPTVSGGGTYAKGVPGAIAFGMWFPERPYPGHDVDEQMPLADLLRAGHVLLETLVDLACGKPLPAPALIKKTP